MTKNTKTILLSLLACLLLVAGFELGEGRIRFGSATLNDSLTSRLTINKGIQVNGVITSSDTLRTSGILRSTELQLTGASPQILWTTYGMNIDGGIDALTYNANAHTINTEAGTSLLYADSAGGLGYLIPGVTGYRGSGTLLRQKLIRGITANTVNGAQTYAHGLANGQIISMTTSVRIDTSDMGGQYGNDVHISPYANTFMGAGFQYHSWYDSLNVGTYLGGSANAIKGDSVFFILSYIQ